MTDARHASFGRGSRLLALGAWAAAQCVGVYSYYTFFEANGYLPAPFVYDKSDTFMDFFHTLYWASDPGRYTEWLSVYPPLNFLALQAVDLLLGPGVAQDGFDLRAKGEAVIWFLVMCYLALPVLMLRAQCWSSFETTEKAALYIITVTASPMLFALERGNLIIFTLPVVSWLLSARGAALSWAFAILVNLKPYFALLGAVFVRTPSMALKCVLISGLVFVVTGLALDANFLLLIRNLFGFSQTENLFSLREVMSLPSSLGAFAAVLRGVDESRAFFGTSLNFGDVASLLDLTRACVVVLALSILVLMPADDRRLKLALAVVLIPSLGIWVGGYALALLLPTLPVLLLLRSRVFYAASIALCMLPLDSIALLTEDIGSMNVFLSESTLDVTWTLGLGSIARPCIALLLLCVLMSELALTRPSPRGCPLQIEGVPAHAR